MLWMKNFLHELDHKQQCCEVHCDSQSAVYLAKNSTFHSRSKHIDVRCHWIRDLLEQKILQLKKIHTDDNWSDMMTKVLSIKKFEKCCEGARIKIPHD